MLVKGATWIARAFFLAAGLAMAVGTMPLAYFFGLYLAHPLLLKYGAPADAQFIARRTSMGRNASTNSWAALRYSDAGGETREFTHAGSIDELIALEKQKSVPMHYVPGWPSTAAIDDYDRFTYKGVWLSIGAVLALCAFWITRRLPLY